MATAAPAQTVLDLKVAHLPSPLGVDDAKPRLSWRSGGDAVQTDYQILVASSADKLAPGKADLWDSGNIKSSATNAAYVGKTLPSSAWVH